MNVDNRLVLLTIVSLTLSSSIAIAQQPAACPDAPTYGNNADPGAFAKVNGISLHYESYGQGAPLLVIHGNGGSINGLRCQISFFLRIPAHRERSFRANVNTPSDRW